MKTEIEKLVEKIYHAQTYGKNCDKLIEKLNRLTAVNKPTKTVKKLTIPDVMPSLLLSELKKILWNTRLSKKQVEKNNKDEMKFDYNQGWTDAINKIISKVK
jgi:hypothetical protein